MSLLCSAFYISAATRQIISSFFFNYSNCPWIGTSFLAISFQLVFCINFRMLKQWENKQEGTNRIRSIAYYECFRDIPLLLKIYIMYLWTCFIPLLTSIVTAFQFCFKVIIIACAWFLIFFTFKFTWDLGSRHLDRWYTIVVMVWHWSQATYSST